MLQAYEGYLEKGQVFSLMPLTNLQGRRRVIITVLDEIPEQKEPPQAQAWREFFDSVNASDEKIPETFERVKLYAGG